jgi:hypothetical protein
MYVCIYIYYVYSVENEGGSNDGRIDSKNEEGARRRKGQT